MCLEDKGPSSITFGGINDGYIKPNATGGNHTAVTIEGNESLWATNFTDIKLNGTSLLNETSLTNDGGGKAIFDTGTYAIKLGSSAYDNYKK